MSEHVLLHLDNKTVGYAKFFARGSEKPARVLHGLPLKTYERTGQDLVVFFHVQIFTEYQEVAYPYGFGGPESPPELLGELNVVGKQFKSFIAWDLNCTTPYNSGEDLGDVPRLVSERTVCLANNSACGKRYVRQNVPLCESIGGPSRSDESSVAFRNAGLEPDTLQIEYRGIETITAQTKTRTASDTPSRLDRRFSRFKRGVVAPTSPSGTPIQVQDSYNASIRQESEAYEHSIEPEEGCRGRGLPSSHNFGDDESDDEIEFRKWESVVDSDDESTAEQPQAEDMASPQEILGAQEIYGNEETSDEDSECSDSSVDVARLAHVLPFPRKRRYVYHTRKRGIPGRPRDLRKQRKELSQRIDNPFLRGRLQCCRSLRCFEEVDSIYAFKMYKEVMGMNREDYKSYLINIFSPEDNCFMLRGKKVCARFLQKGFGFSNDLQCSVKSTPLARAGPTASVLPRLRVSKKKDFIINFLIDYAEASGDMMPHTMFTNLPEVVRKDVYRRLRESYRKEFVNDVPPSMNYFYATWKSHCNSIRTRRNHGFAQCETCLFLKAEIANNQNNLSVIRKARDDLQAHLDMVREEKRMYKHRNDRAVRNPKKYLSIVVDGADQNAYGLPHFIDQSKSDKGHKLKVKCGGLLQHARINMLRLFLMTEEHATGANHVIEAIHRALTDHKNEARRLAEILYVQVDNCARENKNRYFLAYCEMLVALGVFLEVEISFLPVGHTHIDIDQSFSCVSKVLRRSDAATMMDLMRVLRTCYNSRTWVDRPDKIANFSGLCEDSKCIVTSRSLRGFQHFRYFRFTRATGSQENEESFRTQCHTKVQAREEWAPLSLGRVKGFLRFTPDLMQTPTTETSPPDNVTEINKCLTSLHRRNRIQAPRIVADLEILRDEVYTKRVDFFHWDLDACFEMNGEYKTDEIGDEQDGVEEEHEEGHENQYEYESESFIAVKPEASSRSRFWIAMVLDVCDRTNSNTARWLRVLWYSQKQGRGDDFSASYLPSQVYDSARRRHIPYEDQVEVDAVLLQFPSLNTQGFLRANTRSALRQVLGLN